MLVNIQESTSQLRHMLKLPGTWLLLGLLPPTAHPRLTLAFLAPPCFLGFPSLPLAPSWPPWLPMAPPGSSCLLLLAPPGSSWPLHAPPCLSLLLLASPGSSWLLLASYWLLYVRYCTIMYVRARNMPGGGTRVAAILSRNAFIIVHKNATSDCGNA